MTWLSTALLSSLLAPQGEAQEPGRPPAPISGAEMAKKAQKFEPQPIPRVIVKHLKSRKLTIDGGLSDWPKAVPLYLNDPRQVSGTGMGVWRGPKDLSAQAYLAWDDGNIYIALQIRDDWHRMLRKNTGLRQEVPPVDNVLLTFDPKRNTLGLGDDPGRLEDRSIWLADAEELAGRILVWDRLRGNKKLSEEGKYAVARNQKAGLTVIEARIPFALILPIGSEAEDGSCIDLQVEINDYDEATDPMPQTRVGWNFGMGPRIEPGAFGTIMLKREFDFAKDKIPSYPEPGRSKLESPIMGRGAWLDWLDKLQEHPPAFVDAKVPDPAFAGGKQRYELLKKLDQRLAAFPRLDFLEYTYRIQRRMLREVAGMAQEGLPFMWREAFDRLDRRTKAKVTGDTIRISRLPVGGYYVQSADARFVVDPRGDSIERLYLRGGVDFCILTRPTDLTRRQDPLLIRMMASKQKRPFFTHINFHLTGAVPGSMFMCEPGKQYLMRGLRDIEALGRKTKTGKVTPSQGYLVRWGNGRSLLVAGNSLDLPDTAHLKTGPELMIISPQHYRFRQLVQTLRPKKIILDEGLQAEEYPANYAPRLRLEDMLKAQNQIKPLASVLLAPGETIEL